MIYLANVITCKPCCSFVCEFLSRPLGMFVVLAMLLSGTEVMCCFVAMADEQRKGCQFTTGLAKEVGIDNWLHVQLGTALLSLIFAPYIQTRVWQTVHEEVEVEEDPEKPSLVAPMPPQSSHLSGWKVKEAFWNVFWYDLGVVAYFVVLLCSIGWSCLGARWLEESLSRGRLGTSTCDPEGYAANAAQLGLVFVAFVLGYFACFTCYLSCISVPVYQGIPTVASKAHLDMPLRRALSAGMPNSLAVQQPPVVSASNNCKAVQPSKLYTEGPAGTSAKRTPFERASAPGMTMKLLACICLDLVGDATFLLPGLDEEADLAYAPAMAIALKMMFRYNLLAGFGFVEEILPFTDVVPSATLGWLLDVYSSDNACTRRIGIRSDENP